MLRDDLQLKVSRFPPASKLHTAIVVAFTSAMPASDGRSRPWSLSSSFPCMTSDTPHLFPSPSLRAWIIIINLFACFFSFLPYVPCLLLLLLLQFSFTVVLFSSSSRFCKTSRRPCTFLVICFILALTHHLSVSLISIILHSQL